MHTQLLTVEEVAKQLRLSEEKVYKMCANGELPSVRFGRSVRIRPQDLDAFIQQNLTE